MLVEVKGIYWKLERILNIVSSINWQSQNVFLFGLIHGLMRNIWCINFYKICRELTFKINDKIFLSKL